MPPVTRKIAATSTESSSNQTPPSPDGRPPPPSTRILIVMYFVVGITLTALATLAGQVPRPAELSLRDFALPLFDLAAFVMSYQVLDVIGPAVALHKTTATFRENRFATCNENVPDAYMRAVRAQTNQVEQFAPLAVVLLGATCYLGGIVAGCTGAAWVLLRVLYGEQYRRTSDGIASYTVPCYMLQGGLAAACLIGSGRALFESL